MGKPMSSNLIKGGHSLVVYDVVAALVERVTAEGAVAAVSCAGVAAKADVVITMLPDGPEVEQAVLGPGGLLEGVKAGCVICYDIRFCEWIRTYALKGTEVLFVSAQWPSARADHWRTLLRARAIENQMYVVACNRCGVSEETHFGGGSMILGPKGEIYFEGGAGEEAAFAAIDLDEVAKTRNFLTVFEDRVPEIYSVK